MSVTVEQDRSINLAEHAPLVGRIDVSPILDAEGRTVSAVQVLLHEGRYYITAEGFRNLWEVTPRPGKTVARFRSIAISERPLFDVRMSRYGPAGSPCVRLDADGDGPWYVTAEGELHERCL